MPIGIKQAILTKSKLCNKDKIFYSKIRFTDWFNKYTSKTVSVTKFYNDYTKSSLLLVYSLTLVLTTTLDKLSCQRE